MGKKIPKVIKEVAEEGTKKAGRVIKNTGRIIDSDVMKTSGNKVIENIMKTESVDKATAKSILRNEKKVFKELQREASKNTKEFINPLKIEDSKKAYMASVTEEAIKAREKLKNEAIEALIKDGFDPVDFTDEHINNKIKELRKNKKYERTHIPNTKGEQELKYKLLFENGTTLGSPGNEVFVPEGGTTHKRFIEMTRNENVNPDEAIKKIAAEQKELINASKSAEKKAFEKKRDVLVESNRKRTEELRRKIIEREINANYSDSTKLANEIADKVEARNGFVGTNPSEFSESNKKRLEAEQRKKRLEETKDERLRNIQNELEKAGMFGHRPKADFDTSELKGKRHKSEDYYMKYKTAKEHDEALKIFDLKDTNPNKFEEQVRNNPIFDKLKDENGSYGGITKEQLQKARIEAIQNASADDMGFTDYLGYHKVPQKAAAGVGTFWLVNKLASNNGQQTNAQLYGQQPY